MAPWTEKDRRIIAHSPAEIRQHAAAWRLAHRVPRRKARLAMNWLSIAIVVALLAVVGGPEQVSAQGPEPALRDAGGPPEPYFEAMKAYREGLYHLKRSDYALATERLRAAIAGIPVEVMAEVPGYQDMYWTLGEAQEAAGLPRDALESYERWLLLAGDDAAPWTVAKVRALKVQLDGGMVVLIRSQGSPAVMREGRGIAGITLGRSALSKSS